MSEHTVTVALPCPTCGQLATEELRLDITENEGSFPLAGEMRTVAVDQAPQSWTGPAEVIGPPGAECITLSAGFRADALPSDVGQLVAQVVRAWDVRTLVLRPQSLTVSLLATVPPEEARNDLRLWLRQFRLV